MVGFCVQQDVLLKVRTNRRLLGLIVVRLILLSLYVIFAKQIVVLPFRRTRSPRSVPFCSNPSHRSPYGYGRAGYSGKVLAYYRNNTGPWLSFPGGSLSG